MRKLKLDLDALIVEAFDTTPPDDGEGTVLANQTGVPWCGDFTLRPHTCNESACLTCAGPSCLGYTCRETCPATCPNTCTCQCTLLCEAPPARLSIEICTWGICTRVICR